MMVAWVVLLLLIQQEILTLVLEVVELEQLVAVLVQEELVVMVEMV
tara:strand:- start:102 stop:239 length:138 start_codon:yes stop_codon:yes gene_type:complete